MFNRARRTFRAGGVCTRRVKVMSLSKRTRGSVTAVCGMVFLGSLAVAWGALSDDSIDVRYGSEVVIDGVISPGEWSDALTVETSISGHTWTVYLKETGTRLLIATDYPGENMIDLLLDLNHDGGTAPQIDDWDLHSSLSDWEKHGTGSDWSDGYPSPSGWEVGVNIDCCCVPRPMSVRDAGWMAEREAGL
jgi:hypothetical protein